jgi:exodeoxyribonuclease-5
MQLAPDQQSVFDAVMLWYNEKPSAYLTIGGFSGCGKTTLITKLVEELHNTTEIACACFTGKATNVLQQKLTTPVKISTIHSLIYESELIDDGKKNYWIHHLKYNLSYELIIIDEASMISQDIFNDLLSFDIPILFVGDHGQLPPVNDSFNIMKNPVLKLEKIHRQAEGNPIIKWSMWVREGKLLPYTKEETDLGSIQRLKADITDDLLKDRTINDLPLFICGINKTRQHINKKVRKHLFNNSSTLQVSEKVVCLKNNKKKQIFNGQMGTIANLTNEDCDDNHIAATIEMDGGSFFNGKLLKEQFGFLPRGSYQTFEDYVRSLRIDPWFIYRFDYGYCLTTHKAQGSQAPTVVVYNENIYRSEPAMYRRWLYTAITRAEKNLILIG